MLASLGAIGLGVLLGVRHSFEPDHLTAVSTLVADTSSARRGALLGALWGLGHTASLVVVGTALLVSGAMLPDRVAAGFELAVAGMLVVLGMRAIARAFRAGTGGPAIRHSHGGHDHAHAGTHDHVHLGQSTVAIRPFVVGLVHGLAGSGAITAIVFAQLPSFASRLAYIALFGLGSTAGMAIASGVAGASLGRAVRGETQRRRLSFATGVLSVAVGIGWAIPQLATL